MPPRNRKPASPRATDDRLSADTPVPSTLSPEGAEEWHGLIATLAELGTARAADLRAVELLCEVLADEKTLRETIRREGLTIPGADGNQKTHPAAKLLESTRNQAHRLMADFGLTPKGRVQVKAQPKASKNPFDDLF